MIQGTYNIHTKRINNVRGDQFMCELASVSPFVCLFQVSPVTPILMMTSFSPQGHQTASTWTGWPFTNLATAWVWNIPTCVNPSCIHGTRGIFPISSLPVMILKEYKRCTVSRQSCPVASALVLWLDLKVGSLPHKRSCGSSRNWRGKIA